jgi:hypothetical protein
MSVRRSLLVGVAVLALAAPAFAGQLSAGAPLDVTKLIPKATKLVRSQATFKKAVLLEGDGTPSKTGKVNTAAAITKWRFVFNNQGTKGSKFASVFVNYSNGHFGKPVGKAPPFLEDRQITTTPKMTLAKAVSKLQAAGYKSGFYGVTLRYPLGPGFTETLYIFTLGSSAPHPYVSVGIKSGKVKPIA